MHEPPGLAQSAGGLLALGVEHVGHDYLRTFPDEDRGRAQAHAAGPARDQGDLAVESHLAVLLRRVGRLGWTLARRGRGRQVDGAQVPLRVNLPDEVTRGSVVPPGAPV